MGDELILKIDKSLWPKGVARGLTPALRKLGDKHGNLVIAAQPAKGEIMIRGEPKNIEGAKKELRELLAEHLPDAPTPDELKEKTAAKASPKSKPSASPKKEPAASPKKEAAASPKKGAAAAPAKKKEAAPAAPAKPKAPKPSEPVPTVPENPPEKAVTLRRPRAASAAPGSLLWECTRANSSFIRKQAKNVAPTSGPLKLRPTFSTEPCNLLGLHTSNFSGIAADEAIDVRPVKRVKTSPKESVELVQSNCKAASVRRPIQIFVKTGLKKCAKQGVKKIDLELDAKFYRSGLRALAKEKYRKILKTFKKQKRKFITRRARKAKADD